MYVYKYTSERRASLHVKWNDGSSANRLQSTTSCIASPTISSMSERQNMVVCMWTRACVYMYIYIQVKLYAQME